MAIGCVHPEGENEDYDGLYFKQSEMSTLAEQLINVPMCIEHLEGQSVGKVIHAWVGSSSLKRPECFVLFETDDKNLPGHIASELISQGYCNDLSLGHECKIDSNSLSVVSKKPIEVSICTEGARERTHIYGFKDNESKEYISVRSLASKESKGFHIYIDKKSLAENHNKNHNNMSEQAATTNESVAQPSVSLPTSSETTTAETPDSNVMGELISELKALRERNQQLIAQNEEHQKIGKRKREAAVDGSIRDMVLKLYEEYESLGLHKNELEEQLAAMKDSPHANGIVEMLSCAAAKQTASVVQLEKALQERKKLAEENKRLKTQVAMFADPSERTVTETVNAVASRTKAPESTNKFDALFGAPVSSSKSVGKSRGMKELFPNMFENMISSAGPSSTGMQKFGQNDISLFNSKMNKSRVQGSGFETHSFQTS